MRGGRTHRGHLVGRQAEGVGLGPVDRVQGVMTVGDTLGLAGGAGGEHHLRQIVGVRLARVQHGRREAVLPRRAVKVPVEIERGALRAAPVRAAPVRAAAVRAASHPAEQDPVAQCGHRRGDLRGHGAVVEAAPLDRPDVDRAFRVMQHELDLPAPHGGQHGRDNRTGPGTGQDQGGQWPAVGQLHESRSQPLDPAGQLDVAEHVGRAAIDLPADERDLVRAHPSRAP